MPNLNGNGITKYINMKTLLTCLLLAWICWASTGIIEAKVDKGLLCRMYDDIIEMKADIKELLKK